MGCEPGHQHVGGHDDDAAEVDPPRVGEATGEGAQVDRNPRGVPPEVPRRGGEAVARASSFRCARALG